MFGNKIIDFIKNTKNTNGNDWFLGLTSDNQSEVKKTIKDYNKLIKTQGPDLNIDRWEQFSSLSDDVRTDVKTYLKSLEGAKASTEDLNKIMSATMETASSTGTEFVSTGNKIRDFGKKTTTVFKGFGNVVGNSLEKSLKTVGSTMLGIGANVAINAGVGLIINELIDSWDKYTNAQENAIDRGNEAIQSYEDNLSKFNTNSQVISEVGERFEELRKGVSITGQNIGLTTDEYEEYQNIVSQIATSFPELISGYDSLGNPIIGAAQNVRDLTEALQEQQAVMSQENLNNATDYAESFNALVNQRATDFTKESGLLQQREAVQGLLEEINNGEKIADKFGTSAENTSATIVSGISLIGDKIAELFGGQAGQISGQIRQAKDWGYMDTLLYQDIAEAAGIDPDIIQKAQKDIDKASEEEQKEIAEANQYIEQRVSEYYESLNSQLNTAFDNVKPLIESTLTSPTNNASYNSLKDETKDIISSLINNMDFETGQSLGMIDENGNLDTSAITSWGNEIVKKIKSTGVEKELSQLFSVVDNKDSMNLKDYQTEVNNLIDSISSKVPELSKDLLKSTNGIGDSVTNLNQKYRDLISQTSDKEYRKFLDNLSIEDIETLWTLNADSIIKNADEARKALHQAKQEALDLEANPIFDSIAAADEAENAGADYEQAYQYAQQAKEMYDQGLIGTDDFKTRAAYLSPTESDDPANFIENYSKAVRYLTEDKAGVNNFLTDLQNKGMATFTTLSDGTKDWSFNLGDLDEASHKLGIGFEFMMDMFGRMNDYGINNNFFSSIEDGQTHLQELSQSLAEEEARLAELTSPGQYQTTDGKTLGNQTAIDASRKKIELLKNDIVETSELLTQVAERSSQQWESDYNAALTTVQSLSEARKRILADPELSEGAKGYAASQIEAQIKDLANQYGIELDANLNIDTSEIDAIQNKTIQIKGNVDLSEGRTASTEAIQGAGWEASEGTTSVYKSYNSDDQTHSMVITPVLPDGTVLTPEQTQEYVNQLFAGQEIEPDIKVATFVGEDAATQAQNYTESINSINAAVATGSEEIQGYLNDLKQFNASELEGIDFADGQLSKGEESLENFMNAVGVSTDKSSEFIAVLRDMGYIGMNSAQEIIQSVEGINFDTVREQVTAANDTLLALGATDIRFNISTEDLGSIEEQISNAKSLVESFQNSSGQVDLSIDGAQEALQILSALIDRKQTLSQPAIMSVDTSGLSDAQSSIISVVQQWQSAYDEVQKLQQMSDVGVNVDVELGDAQSQLDSLTQQLQSLSDNSETAELMASIKLDPSSADPATIASQIGEIPIDVKGNIVGWEDNSTAEDKDAKVNYTLGDYPETVPDAKGEVNYTVGDTPDSVPDAKGKANYTAGDTPETVPNATGKANYTAGDTPETVPDAKGTANFDLGESPEQVPNADGIADFDLGEYPSIVPDASGEANYTLGDYPTSLPPITQTVYVSRVEDSEATGTMISPAKASGTAYNVINTIPAHAGGNVALSKNEQALVNEFAPQSPESIVRDGRWFIIPGGPHIESLKKGDIIFNAQQTAQLLKAGKTSSPGKAFAEGTMPHVRNLVSTSLNAYADGSDDTLEYIDWIERIFNKLEREFTHITNQMERIAHLTDKQVKAYEALAKNREYLNTTQSAISTYRSHLNSIGLSSDIINKIKNGSLEITQYDEDTRELISEYQDYYTKLQDCSAQYDDLLAQQDELAQTALDNVSNYYDMFNQVDQAMQGWLEAQRDLWENQGLSATADSQYASIQSSLEQERKVAERLEQKISSYTDEINKLISNGYMDRHSEAYYEAQEALNGFKQELYESQSAIIEFEDQLRELDYTALQNKIDGFAQAVDKISAQINLMEARDEQVPESLYQQQIDANNSQIEANMQLRTSKLKEQGLYDVGSTRYQELAEEINKLDVATLNLRADNEALKDSIYELRFDRLDNQLKVYDDLKTEIDDFRSLLNEDAFFDKNGVVTEEGLAELALLQQGIIASKREVADYREGLEKLKESYVNGVISLDEYNEKSEEYCAGIRESIKDVSDYEDALTDLYMTQMRTESEALQEVIDKRKEALQAKESYYQYDQTLKSQTKDVNMLQAQIQALEGVNNAAAQAEVKRLRAELETAQQTLDDTKREHAIDMQQQGYDSMSDQLNQILEDTEYEITHNAEKQQEVVQSMLNNVVNMYESAYGKINSIIENTGWAGSYAFRQNQTQLSTSTGAQTQTNNATQNQSNVKPSDAANSTITNPIDNNESYNNKVEQEITQAPNTENRLVAELKLSPTSVSLEEGKSTKITATMRPNDAKNKTLSWKSSNTSIATVSGGTIKAIKAGSCQITASTTDGSGLSVTVGVTVTAKPKPVQPEKKPSTPSTGGDGVPNIGDAVTYTSGRYYYSSDGLKPSGNQYLGKTVYIGHINNADWATKPYALYADKDFKHPLGWVSLDQISGYAKGTKSVPYEQIAEVNEEGRELIVTSDGRVLRRLQPGDGVIPNNITENLLKMGENPAKFVQDAITQVQTPVVNKISSGDMNVTNHYDSLLTVNGNVDKEALPELKEILKKSYDYTVQNIAKDAAKMGFKKRF